MSDVAALAYADWRGLVNQIRTIRHSPGRLVIWLIFAAVIGFFAVSRFVRHTHRETSLLAPGLLDSSTIGADVLMCGMIAVALIGIAVGNGSRGLFRTRAEAQFVIGSPVPARVAVVYLLARDSIFQTGRTLLSTAYLLFILTPRELGNWQLGADIALIAAILIATFAIGVPRQLLHGSASFGMRAIALLGIVAIALPVIRDGLGTFPAYVPHTTAILAVMPAWHPGRVLLQPNLPWLILALALAAGAIGWLSVLATDAYPELLAMSVARFESRSQRLAARIASRQHPSPRSERAIQSARTAPAGVLVYLWKSTLDFDRTSSPRTNVFVVAVLLAAGYGFGLLCAIGDGAIFGIGLSFLLMFTFVFSAVASNALALELRRPLFWLSSAWLFERLIALAAGRWWLRASCAALVGIGFTLSGVNAFESVALIVGLPVLFFLDTSVGFAAFAIMPRDADQKGPLALVRTGVAFLLLAPPIVAFGVVFFVANAGVFAFVVGISTALAESLALLALAAWRLDGRIDRLSAT